MTGDSLQPGWCWGVTYLDVSLGQSVDADPDEPPDVIVWLDAEGETARVALSLADARKLAHDLNALVDEVEEGGGA